MQLTVIIINLTCLLLNILLGIRLGLFTPDLAFEVVAKKQIEKLKNPCLTVTELVAGELSKVAKSAFDKVRRETLTVFLWYTWAWACPCFVLLSPSIFFPFF